MQPFEHGQTKKTGLLIVDFDTETTKIIATEFNVHNIYYDAGTRLFTGVNKYGPQYLTFRELDGRDLKHHQVKDIPCALSGHVASVPTEEFLYFTALRNSKNESVLATLHKKSGRWAIEAELGLSDPPAHDCKFSSDGLDLLITNFNKLHRFNLKTHKLVSQELQLATKASSLRHFSIGPHGEVCVQSNVIQTGQNYTYDTAEILLISKGGSSVEHQQIKAVDPNLAKAELLDFSFDLSGSKFACVHAGKKTLSIWQTFPLQCLKVINFETHIQRVASFFDRSQFLVIGSGRLDLIDTRNYSRKPLTRLSRQFDRNFIFSHKTLVAIDS